jgi:hypothetical protein
MLEKMIYQEIKMFLGLKRLSIVAPALIQRNNSLIFHNVHIGNKHIPVTRVKDPIFEYDNFSRLVAFSRSAPSLKYSISANSLRTVKHATFWCQPSNDISDYIVFRDEFEAVEYLQNNTGIGCLKASEYVAIEGIEHYGIFRPWRSLNYLTYRVGTKPDRLQFVLLSIKGTQENVIEQPTFNIVAHLKRQSEPAVSAYN